MSCGIRKCVLVFFLVFAASFLFAQEQDEDYSAASTESASDSEEMDLYYFNLPIERIFIHQRGYYIVYRTSTLGLGTLCVPWEWMNDPKDHRAIYNAVKLGIQPYISYVTNNGEFYQLRINAPLDKRDAIWGEMNSNKVSSDRFDVDTLTLKF